MQFPGAIPDDLEGAYRIQDRAIAQWPDTVVGWKVGYIAPERRGRSGEERLLGPIFAGAQSMASADSVPFEVFDGGFGAVEAEYVLRLEADMPHGQQHWSPEQAGAFPSTLHLGVEIASSPLATINQLGPRVVVCDFGNNNGLILGQAVERWQDLPETSLTCHTWIEGRRVGSGGATTLPGGLRAAFAFALSASAQRGRRLRTGDLIATGNATGIHDINVGERARIVFDGCGEINCHAQAARPRLEGVAR
ncbi:MAG: 2-keto-4-pentenoate hydratase [Thermomonas sp.]